jgi:hypothetical protein
MLRFLLLISFLLFFFLPVHAEDWFKINNNWKADRSSIIKTKKYYLVWLYDNKNKVYYYNQYKKDVPMKLVRQKQPAGTKVVHYPEGNEYTPINNEDKIIIKAIMTPSYVCEDEQNDNKSLNFKNLIALKLEHTIEYVFKTYTSDIQQKTETSLFYIDPKHKQVYRKDKTRVDYIKEFNESKIAFMIVDYTDKFKICRCYDIDRYTGDVVFTLFQHPMTLGAKFDHSILDIKDGYIGQGKGFATKINISKQKF